MLDARESTSVPNITTLPDPDLIFFTETVLGVHLEPWQVDWLTSATRNR